MSKRYLPDRAFPSYVFIPGENPHPKKVGGHMEGQADPVATPIDPQAPEKNEYLRYSLDLLNHEYFWESHVYFEALWNAHGRVGPIAEFLKALIKLGAAGVKRSIGQKEAASGHCDRACELLNVVRHQVGDDFLGFDLKSLIDSISRGFLTAHPSWD
jgi:uncharacterized protein